MSNYTKPEVKEIEITANERIASCDPVGSIPGDLPPGIEIEDMPIES